MTRRLSAMAVRSILITGCSRGGAGAALARKFHQNGFRVFATARDSAKSKVWKLMVLRL